MKVLIACEESQVECLAFREKGHESYSCDIVSCSGGYSNFHIKNDALNVINGNCIFKTEDGVEHYVDKWDLIIAHPPCTFLSSAGNRWFNENVYGKKAILRKKKRIQAAEFFMKFINADCEKIAVENPVGFISQYYRIPDQILQPYNFGEPVQKKICLWLKNLNPLKETERVTPNLICVGDRLVSEFCFNTRGLTKDELSIKRSKSFVGVAKAMAEQWG